MSTRKPKGSDRVKRGVASGGTKRAASDLGMAPTAAADEDVMISDLPTTRVDHAGVEADRLADQKAEGDARGASRQGGNDDDGKHRHRKGKAVGLVGHGGSSVSECASADRGTRS